MVISRIISGVLVYWEKFWPCKPGSAEHSCDIPPIRKENMDIYCSYTFLDTLHNIPDNITDEEIDNLVIENIKQYLFTIDTVNDIDWNIKK